MIYIAFDANFLFLPNTASFHKCHFNSEFDKAYSLATSGKTRDATTILLPEIALREYWKRRCDDYVDIWKSFSDGLKSLEGFVKANTTIGWEAYPEYLNQQIEQFIEQTPKVEKLPLCGEMYFSEIVQRAILKQPPFEGKNGNGKASDKGFKDTLLYYSILDYAKSHPGEYYLLTHDKVFYTDDGRSLKAHFRKNTGQLLYILEKSDDLKVELTFDAKDSPIESVSFKESNEKYQRGNPQCEPTMDIFLNKKMVDDKKRHSLKRINRELSAFYESLRAEWNQVPLDHVPYWENMGFKGTVETDVLFNASGLLCYLFKSYAYYGGAHGGQYHKGMTFFLDSGEEACLSALLGVEEGEAIEMVCNAILEDKKRCDYYNESYSPKFSNEEEINFFVDSTGISIILNEYEAACYASGIRYVFLAPLEQIKLHR